MTLSFGFSFPLAALHYHLKKFERPRKKRKLHTEEGNEYLPLKLTHQDVRFLPVFFFLESVLNHGYASLLAGTRSLCTFWLY